MRQFLILLSVVLAIEAKCVFKEVCDDGQPCKSEGNNVNPTPLASNDTYKILEGLCTEFISPGEPLCCDDAQVNQFSGQFGALAALLQRCPSCYFNLARIFCHMTCSPQQDSFINVTGTQPSEEKKGFQSVTSINYFMSENYVGLAYDSCLEVNNPAVGPAIFLVCGPYGYHCSPKNLLKFMGEQSPFRLNFKFSPEGKFTLFDHASTKCSEAPFNGSQACSCTDCSATCPPFILPPEENSFCIVGFDGYYALSILFFILLVGIFEAWFILSSRRAQPSPNPSCEILYQDLQRSSNNKTGAVIVFEKIGLCCASYPWTVIIIGLLVCVLCSLGNLNFNVITDPVELWSASDAQARVERNYYNKHLGPFYRVQQVIILNKGGSSFNYTSALTDTTYEFSPVFHLDFFLDVLDLQKRIMALEAVHENNTITLQDICFSPLDQKCAIQSASNWFQNDESIIEEHKADYLDHILDCINNAALTFDVDSMGLGCLGDYGGPSFKYVALGGYDEGKETMAEALVLTFLVNNHEADTENAAAIAWEEEFVKFMKDYGHPNMSIAFMAENSINSELHRESKSDISTIAISYLLMFAYVSFALGRYKSSWSTLLLHSQITLGAMGVLLVLIAVISSIGLFSIFGVPSTLIIFEVIPFLVLAVGVDNIFIFVQTHQRTKRLDGETSELHIARVLGKVGPSMLMASASEVTCFFLGATTTMPAVRIFALYAAMALLVDFFLQITVFVALLSLDVRRQENKRLDFLCCFKFSSDDDGEFEESYLYRFMRYVFSPVIRKPAYRNGVMITFMAWLFFSAAIIHKLDVGLDQEISMPHDSYLQEYFKFIKNYLNVGPPVYFVIENGFNYSSDENQNLIGAFTTALNDSLVNEVQQASRAASHSYISAPAMSWIDDYFGWTKACCREFANHTRCYTDKTDCTECPSDDTGRPTGLFETHIRDFLAEIPDRKCPKAGHAAYSNAVELSDGLKIGATSFMTYHTVLKTSVDFTNALKLSRYIANSIEEKVKKGYSGDPENVKVYTYSIFYVFYEQYLTIWRDVFIRLLISFAGVAIITLTFMKLDPVPTLAICLTIFMIVIDTMGVMYFANVSLNAISLVNLVMCVGISVEFCSHITKAFAEGLEVSPIERSIAALANTGSSVLSGITCTKFAGVLVLAFASSQLFVVFYFRMYLAIVLIGSVHGLVFLPVFLAIFGGELCLPKEPTDEAPDN